MTPKLIDKTNSLLNNAKNVIITSHKKTDGDAIGSSLALLLLLKKLNINSKVIVPNDYPNFLKWLPQQEEIIKYEDDKILGNQLINEADLIFSLDYNAFHRTGDMCDVLTHSNATKIMIDHHQSPDDYATVTYSDTSMSSTCEMIYNFIWKIGHIDLLDVDISTCIYTGIMTDTGSFRFRSTTSTTHQIISKLIDCGANNTKIHNSVYDTNSYNRLQLLATALTNLRVIAECNTAYITLSQRELNSFDYKKGDTEGVVNYALSLNNIVLAAIFIEDKKNNIIKISLRSKGNFSVNELSRAHFEGGGHTNAAGGKSEDNLDDTVKRFISILPLYKTALNNEI